MKSAGRIVLFAALLLAVLAIISGCYEASNAFCGTSGVQLGWLASQADMLADDWVFAE